MRRSLLGRPGRLLGSSRPRNRRIRCNTRRNKPLNQKAALGKRHGVQLAARALENNNQEEKENATRTQNTRRTTSLHLLQRTTRPTHRRATQMTYKCQKCDFTTNNRAAIILHGGIAHKNLPTITAKE